MTNDKEYRQAKRKATELARIMEDMQVSLDEAETVYTERRRRGGKIAGLLGGRPFRDKELAKKAGKKGAEKRWGDDKRTD
ncbi:MAG: hypothetical protein EOL91_09990 [Actinobacteria bacterium]|nr:hypothetical protein [Actinomycetota bacterium]